MCPSLHSQRCHLSSQFVAAACRKALGLGLANVPAAERGFARTVFVIFGLRRIPDRLVLTGAVPAPERRADPDPAHQRHAGTLSRPDARRSTDLRTPNQPKRNG